MKIIIKLLSLFLLFITASCGKKYLDYKPSANQLVPVKVEDFQAMLDNTTAMNESSAVNLGTIGSDEYYVTAAQYPGTSLPTPEFQKNAYIWAEKIYVGRDNIIDWNSAYNHILLANYAIEGTDKMGATPDNQDGWNQLRGGAFFFRGYNLYQLAQLYCPVYNATTAETDMGLPLRTDSDPSMKFPRASVAATYQKIIEDLEQAEALLVDKPITTYRPGKAAVYATLTRVYMQMGDYAKAKDYADKCLAIQNGLINFNTVNLTASLSFPVNGVGNPEVIFVEGPVLTAITVTYYNPDSTLLKSYTNGDLRSKVYYLVTGTTTKKTTFKGSYKGSTTSYFSGLATDEVYLNRAECLARTNNAADALADLNKLRQNRFTPATYVPLQSTDVQQVLDWIVAERRIELVLRGTRWPDLRRLNKEPGYATALKRVLDTQTFELKPNDLRWTWPLPVEAIENGGYAQNPR